MKRNAFALGIAFLGWGLFTTYQADHDRSIPSQTVDIGPLFPTTTVDRITAKCEAAIGRKLTEPATATFSYVTVTADGVTGILDAEDGNGGQLHRGWTCTETPSGSLIIGGI